MQCTQNREFQKGIYRYPSFRFITLLDNSHGFHGLYSANNLCCSHFPLTDSRWSSTHPDHTAASPAGGVSLVVGAVLSSTGSLGPTLVKTSPLTHRVTLKILP